MKGQWMRVLWPGFFMAIPAVGIVFSLVDPAEMHIGGSPVEIGRLGIYTLGFLFFWAMGAACSTLTCMLLQSPGEVNRGSPPPVGPPTADG